MQVGGVLGSKHNVAPLLPFSYFPTATAHLPRASNHQTQQINFSEIGKMSDQTDQKDEGSASADDSSTKQSLSL